MRFETELTVLNALIALTDDGRPRLLLSSWIASTTPNAIRTAPIESWSIERSSNTTTRKKSQANPLPSIQTATRRSSCTRMSNCGACSAAEVPATHFAWCSSDCTSNAGWIANKLADENWEGAALRFDEQGGAHVFAAEVTYEVGVPNDRIPVYAKCAAH